MKSNYFTQEVAFSSAKDDWTTPKWLFDELNAEFHFTVDLCADDENHLCDRYFTKENSCLDAELTGEKIYCNPPYGRDIGKFVRKCSELSGGGGNLVVMLLPARTDTKAFHKYIYNQAEIRFIKGRLKFGEAQNSAPFPSMIVVFRGKET